MHPPVQAMVAAYLQVEGRDPYAGAEPQDEADIEREFAELRQLGLLQ